MKQYINCVMSSGRGVLETVSEQYGTSVGTGLVDFLSLLLIGW